MAMVAERDIVLVSVPFAVGAAASAWLFEPAAAHFFFLSVTVLLFLLSLGKADGIQAYCLLFFSLGGFCGCGSALFGHALQDVPAFAEKALAGLQSLIENVPFRHERTSALLRALLTGQRDMLPAESMKAFRDAGASHILALSGLHLGMIYMIAGKLLLVLGNSRPACILRSILLLALSAFYSVVTGASPSIVRALLFIALNEFVRNSPGRERDPMKVWCAGLFLQLVIMPPAISSTGFQLSYLAMLGIFTLFPKMEGWYPGKGRWDPFRKMWCAMALSCSCQLFTAPLVWLRFGTFPKYFILTNILALPLVSALITSAVACLALSAAGICPGWLAIMTDSLAELLQGCLEIIAGM